MKHFSACLVFLFVFSVIAKAEDAVTRSPAGVAGEIKSELHRNLGLWYPRTLDIERGGFHTDFRRDWSLSPYKTKGIVAQSRLTWTAAEAALRQPGNWKDSMTPVVKHGTEFLREKMWDHECGGFYWEIDADGTPPTENEEMKHAYGISFAIYGLARSYELTQNPADLEAAKAAFQWLDRFGHDARFGGYIEAFYRDGRPMLTPPEKRPYQTRGKVGELLGTKSMNTHIHLLESFTALYRVWPDETLRSRLEELLLIASEKIATWPGAMRQFFRNDWTAAATYVSFGHDVETAFLLLEAAETLGRPDDPNVLTLARSMVDHSLEFGWDETHGGFYDEGATFGHAWSTKKVWWAQAEGLNGLLVMHKYFGKEDPRYYSAFIKQWNFIRRFIIDDKYGGWVSQVDADGLDRRRPNIRDMDNAPELGKASLWKTSYHECRALINVLEILESITGEKP